LRRRRAPVTLTTEDAATAPVAVAAAPSLAALLTGHILHDGELVILILRPSLWFIVLQSLPAAAVVLLMAIIAAVADGHVTRHDRSYVAAALLLISARLMWSTLQWMGRLYILTDLRILRISGVFTIDLFDCPLRKVATTTLTALPGERLLGVGSIVIEPKMELVEPGVWQTIAQPREIHEKVVATIARAKQNGMGHG
jgi:hypothetical protein